MEVEQLLFWIIVGVMIGALIILVANKLIVNLVQVNVFVKPG
jgi:hypothetical protein